MSGKKSSPVGRPRPVSGTLGAAPVLPEVSPGAASTKSRVTTAMLLMITAMIIAPLMDVFAKILSTQHGISPVTITWTRFIGQTILMLGVVLITLGVGPLKRSHAWMNIFRGVLIGAAVSIFFIAVKYLPLADAIAIFFVEPLFVILLSVLFLGERIGWRRMSAALFGFAGAMLIIQPTYEVFGLKSLLPLATAALFSIYLVLSKIMGSKDRPLVMQFWSGIGGVAVCSAFLIVGQAAGVGDMTFTMPHTLPVFLYLGATILIATVAHLMIVVAFTRANASILAPFQYLEIVTLAIAGYWVFGDFPTPIKWLGIFMIISSGLYIFMREKKLSGPQEVPQSKS